VARRKFLPDCNSFSAARESVSIHDVLQFSKREKGLELKIIS
jgi:hypothetical protein